LLSELGPGVFGQPARGQPAPATAGEGPDEGRGGRLVAAAGCGEAGGGAGLPPAAAGAAGCLSKGPSLPLRARGTPPGEAAAGAGGDEARGAMPAAAPRQPRGGGGEGTEERPGGSRGLHGLPAPAERVPAAGGFGQPGRGQPDSATRGEGLAAAAGSGGSGGGPGEVGGGAGPALAGGEASLPSSTLGGFAARVFDYANYLSSRLA